MSDTLMKRKKAASSTNPGYPSADEIRRDRRGFLGILGKGLLGVSVLGLARCDGGAGAPIPQDAATDVLGTDEWHTAGIAPPPDTIEDLAQEDWAVPGGMRQPEDTTEEDWNLGGAPRPPDTVDTIEDIEDEFPPLMGDMPAPDVVVHGDVKEDEVDAFPPLDGDMPIPDEP